MEARTNCKLISLTFVLCVYVHVIRRDGSRTRPGKKNRKQDRLDKEERESWRGEGDV